MENSSRPQGFMKQNLKKILYSPGGNDEYKTPAYAVNPLLEFIKENSVIWCPFDTKESWFVKIIGTKHKVIYSHISFNQDFFEYEPNSWDIIISNPPFTNKRKFFERAIYFRKPFALLMSNTWLNDSAPKQLFGDSLQLLMFDKRIDFIGLNGEINKKTAFSSSYFCKDFLPKQIICRKLNKDM